MKDQYASDGEKWALELRPTSFSDSIAIRLNVVPGKWSQCQFFWQQVVSSESLPALYAAAIAPGALPYPNSLCLHLVVYSNEGMVLLTRAHSAKLNDYPLSWACSIGEQLASEDISNLSQDCAQKWVHRALDEELSIAPSEVDEIRFLALTFEGDIANFAMLGVAHLRLSQHDVMARLRTTNRLDNEFSAIEFISVDEIPSGLIALVPRVPPSPAAFGCCTRTCTFAVSSHCAGNWPRRSARACTTDPSADSTVSIDRPGRAQANRCT